MRVKIGGTNSAEALAASVAVHAEDAGTIFFPRSTR